MTEVAPTVVEPFLDLWDRGLARASADVEQKPSAVGIAVGAVCGLVAITPAAGYVGVTPAILIGLVVGVASNAVANWRASRNLFDDALDVFACHGIGSMWGVIATGIFASTAINP